MFPEFATRQPQMVKYSLFCETCGSDKPSELTEDLPAVPLFTALKPSRTASGISFSDADTSTNLTSMRFNHPCGFCGEISPCSMEIQRGDEDHIVVEFQAGVQKSTSMPPTFELDNCMWMVDRMIAIHDSESQDGKTPEYGTRIAGG